MHAFCYLLAMLLFFHALADYPFQGEFLSKAKSARAPLPDVPWYLALASHAFIQAGFVLLATGSLALLVAEFVCHALIDHLKCTKRIRFLTDQVLHVACKVCWAVVVIYVW